MAPPVKRGNIMKYLIGKSPVAKPLFVLSKLCLFVCVSFPLIKLYNSSIMLYDGPLNNIITSILLLIGAPIVAGGVISLGSSTRVGLPEEKTKLKTDGLYGISRNPIYLGGFILCLASCAFALHIVNFICAATTMIFHHQIVLAEETFLENKFKDEWLEYRGKVRRYL